MSDVPEYMKLYLEEVDRDVTSHTYWFEVVAENSVGEKRQTSITIRVESEYGYVDADIYYDGEMVEFPLGGKKWRPERDVEHASLRTFKEWFEQEGHRIIGELVKDKLLPTTKELSEDAAWLTGERGC